MKKSTRLAKFSTFLRCLCPGQTRAGAEHRFRDLAAAVMLFFLVCGSALRADQAPADPISLSKQPASSFNETPTNRATVARQPAATDLKAAIITSMDALDEKHKLAIGDRLSFRIEEDQEEPRALNVTDSGDLELPYIGRFPAENKTCKQLAQEIKTALEKEYYYQATVIIAVDLMTKSRGKVYLVGPIRMPGPQDIPGDEILTLSKAILRAGGFNDFADKHSVKVTRKVGPGDRDKKTFVVDVADIFDKGKVERDLPLEPGDLIFIPERMIRF